MILRRIWRKRMERASDFFFSRLRPVWAPFSRAFMMVWALRAQTEQTHSGCLSIQNLTIYRGQGHPVLESGGDIRAKTTSVMSCGRYGTYIYKMGWYSLEIIQVKDFSRVDYFRIKRQRFIEMFTDTSFFLSTALKSKSSGDVRAQMKTTYFKWSSTSAIRRNVTRGSCEVSAHV